MVMNSNRIPVAKILVMKVMLVLPRPFIILLIIVLVYINGQEKAKALTILFTKVSLKINSEKSAPIVKKNKAQEKPIRKLESMDNFDTYLIEDRFPALCFFETDGSRSTAADWNIVAGKVIKEIAIPVRAPYTLKASLEFSP